VLFNRGVNCGNRRQRQSERKRNHPHIQADIRTYRKQNYRNRKMNRADNYQRAVYLLFLALLSAKRLRKRPFENKQKQQKGSYTRKNGRKKHHREVFPKVYVRRRCEINVRRIADYKTHAPGVGGNKFRKQIRNGVYFRVLCETAYKRRKRKHYNVVGSKHGQHGNERVKFYEQPALSFSSATYRLFGKVFEKS